MNLDEVIAPNDVDDIALQLDFEPITRLHDELFELSMQCSLVERSDV